MEEEVCEKSPLLVCLLFLLSVYVSHKHSAASYSFVGSLKAPICSVHLLMNIMSIIFFVPWQLTAFFFSYRLRAGEKRYIMLRHALYSSIWSYHRSPCVYVI